MKTDGKPVPEPRKLRLARESLRQLDNRDLTAVNGGASQNASACTHCEACEPK